MNRFIKNLPLTRKLAIIIVVFSVIIFILLGASFIGFESLSSLRAIVGAEGFYAKAQKDASFYLERYINSHDEADYNSFTSALNIDLSYYKNLRLEFLKPNTDFNVSDRLEILGGMHPGDIRSAGYFFKYGYVISYIKQDYVIWAHADNLIQQLSDLGDQIHQKISSGNISEPEIKALSEQLLVTNTGLTKDVNDFENNLGKVSRLAKQVIEIMMIIITLLLSVLGIYISYQISKYLYKEIDVLRLRAGRIATGEFSEISSLSLIESKDEIGQLAASFKIMAQKLKDSYANLEEKVRARTSELQEAKAKDEAILTSMGDALVVADKDGRITMVNKTFEKLLLWKTQEVIGKGVADIIIRQDEEGNVISFDKQLKKGAFASNNADTTIKDWYFIRKDKARIPVAFLIDPVIFEGNMIGTVEAFRDITKEKALDKAKSEFVFMTSHQLRTPLSAVKWYLEMLTGKKMRNLTKKQKEYLKVIDSSNNRMIELINALLNVSRIELGKLAITPEILDIKKSIEDNIKEQSHAIQNKKRKVSILLSGQIPRISTDPKLLRVIIQNILSNAVKYTKPGGEITFTVTNPGEYIQVECQDTGIGIPEKQQSRIFEKFFRADNAIKTEPEGTGLGLFIVKAVLELLGGTITFQSKENEGSTFVFTLPLKGVRPKIGSKDIMSG